MLNSSFDAQYDGIPPRGRSIHKYQTIYLFASSQFCLILLSNGFKIAIPFDFDVLRQFITGRVSVMSSDVSVIEIKRSRKRTMNQENVLHFSHLHLSNIDVDFH